MPRYSPGFRVRLIPSSLVTMKHSFILLLSFLAFSVPGTCLADEDVANTSISGFGTLGVSDSSRGEFGFVRNASQKGNTAHAVSFENDTRLGVQLNHKFNQQFELVGQVIAKSLAKQTLDTIVSQAFLSYRPTPGVNLRLGRLSGSSSSYLMGEYVNVGYSYPWVRPPESMYSSLSMDNVDGADLSYTLINDDAFWRFKVLAGKIRSTAPVFDDAAYLLESKGLWGVTIGREQGPLKLLVGYSTFKLVNDYTGSSDWKQATRGFAAVPGNPYGADALVLLNDFSLQGKRVNFASASAAYDDGNWMAQGEIGRLAVESKAFPQGTQAYLSVGHHFGKFLPFAIAGTFRSSEAIKAKGNWGVFGADAGALQADLINSLNALRVDNDTYGLGMRWDFDSRVALKAQWSRMHMRENGWGGWYFDKTTKANTGAANVDIASVTLDFVF